MSGGEFEGRTALVTGAGSGIGLATALKLATEGAQLAVIDLDREGAEKAAAEVERTGARAIAIVADVSDPQQVEDAVSTTVGHYGALHLALNNAGVTGPMGLLADLEVDEYRRLVEINLHSIFYGLKFQIPAILTAGGGSIVNTSSALGLVGEAVAAPYVAAKHGLTGLTKAAAAGYAALGVRVNSIHPGYIDTAMTAGLSPEDYAALAELHPMARLGSALEVAEVAAFLLSERAAFVTGAQYTVDGGYTAV